MAEGITSFLTPGELQHLDRMVLQSRYVVEGTLAGRHRSPLRGASSEFADHRAYIAGDDPKFIDWKVLGRTDRYFVRRFEDETILRVYFIVDRSASMGFSGGDGRPTKYEYAGRLAAALGYVVVRSKDASGLYLYADRLNAALPPRNSLTHWNNAIKVLRRNPPAAATNTAATLHRIAESIQRRALIVLCSDLLDDQEAIARALAHFRRHHHDVIVFHVLDPKELDFSFAKGARFEDMETGEEVVADPRALMEEYRRVFGAFLDGYRRRCAEMNIDYRLARTDHDLAPYVRAYLDERKRLSR